MKTDLTGLALVISAVLTPTSVVMLAWLNQRNAKKAAVKVEAVKIAVAENAAESTTQLAEIAETTKVIHELVNSDMTKALKGQLIALQAQLRALEQSDIPTDTDDDLILKVRTQIEDLEVTLAQRAQKAQDMENGTAENGHG